jgi:hypothetical protein
VCERLDRGERKVWNLTKGDDNARLEDLDFVLEDLLRTGAGHASVRLLNPHPALNRVDEVGVPSLELREKIRLDPPSELPEHPLQAGA